jgi:hypothetical protein
MPATLVRRSSRLLVLGPLAAAASLIVAIGVPAAQASTSPGFDDQASLFKIFWDCSSGCSTGHGSVTDQTSVTEDGQALEINYASGNQAFEGLDAYDSASFGTDASALRYQVNYDFRFPNQAPIQALEFCMNNYFGGKRYQWAMQFENKGTGAPQWRIWGGHDSGVKWKPIGIPATNITAGHWYTLTIDGNIINGQVHYLDFIIAGTNHSLTQYTFPPDASSGPGLVAAVQVDGDSNADPYQLYLDNSHYFWSNTASKNLPIR